GLAVRARADGGECDPAQAAWRRARRGRPAGSRGATGRGGRPGTVRPAGVHGSTNLTSGLDILLWVVVPYVGLAILIGGHVWRYRYDKFGWTTRSSQLYESTLLRWGSPLFHFGILVVFLGHVMGLGVPKSWTQAVGISDAAYHVLAVGLGAVAGFCTLVGAALLIYRRRTVGPVFSATTRMDKLMWFMLGLVIVLGLGNTVLANLIEHYDYREGVSIWFRGIFYFDTHPELMAEAPLGFELHGFTA